MQVIKCHLCDGLLREISTYEITTQVTSDCRPWRSEGKLAACARCGLVQKPISAIWLEEVNKIYAEYAVYEQGGGAEQSSFDTHTGYFMARSQRISAWLQKHARVEQNGMLLDIGCGNGAFLKAFGQDNPQWQMAGFELDARNKTVVESIPGVKQLYVDSVGSIDQKFELIVMVHALEHIPKPAIFLKETADKLNPGGKLLIQVPDLQTSPFDLLISDHCSHFSAVSLSYTLNRAGYKVIKFDTTCIAKELTVLAEPIDANHVDHELCLKFENQDEQCAIRHLKWICQVLQQGRHVRTPFGIFGTSISGTLLESALEHNCSFFVDEDINRIGRTHLGKPIYSPAQTPKDIDILMPMPRKIAGSIINRLSPYRLRLIPPPQLDQI